jgi:hypothetical protein
MTDLAKRAIAKLMYTSSLAAYESAISVIETELRLCRAETLREVGRQLLAMDAELHNDVAQWIYRMAEEAER